MSHQPNPTPNSSMAFSATNNQNVSPETMLHSNTETSTTSSSSSSELIVRAPTETPESIVTPISNPTTTSRCPNCSKTVICVASGSMSVQTCRVSCFLKVIPSSLQKETTKQIKILYDKLPRKAIHNYDKALVAVRKKNLVNGIKLTKTDLANHVLSLGLVLPQGTFVEQITNFAEGKITKTGPTMKLKKVTASTELPRPPLYQWTSTSLVHLATLLGCVEIKKSKSGLIKKKYQGEILRERTIKKIKAKQFNPASTPWPIKKTTLSLSSSSSSTSSSSTSSSSTSSSSTSSSSTATKTSTMTPGQYHSAMSSKTTTKKRKNINSKDDHNKRLKVAEGSTFKTGGRNQQSRLISEKMFDLSDALGEVVGLNYIEALYEYDETTKKPKANPYKIRIVSADGGVDSKFFNMLKFLMENQDKPDQVQFFQSKEQVQNLTDLQNGTVLKRKKTTPERTIPSGARRLAPIEEISSSQSEED